MPRKLVSLPDYWTIYILDGSKQIIQKRYPLFELETIVTALPSNAGLTCSSQLSFVEQKTVMMPHKPQPRLLSLGQKIGSSFYQP